MDLPTCGQWVLGLQESQAGRPSLHSNLLQRQPRCAELGRVGQLRGLVTWENALLGLHNSVLYKTKAVSGRDWVHKGTWKQMQPAVSPGSTHCPWYRRRHSLKSHREAKTQGRTRPAEVCVSVLSSQIFAVGTSRKEQMVMEVWPAAVLGSFKTLPQKHTKTRSSSSAGRVPAWHAQSLAPSLQLHK